MICLAADERAGLTGPCEIQWVLADDSPSWHCDGTMHAMLSDGLFPLMIALWAADETAESRGPWDIQRIMMCTMTDRNGL